jgi:hypothetical protein
LFFANTGFTDSSIADKSAYLFLKCGFVLFFSAFSISAYAATIADAIFLMLSDLFMIFS